MSFDNLFVPRQDVPEDLKLFDGLRVIFLLWIMTLGTSEYLTSAAVTNPWTLDSQLLTIPFTVILSSNIGFDFFFFLAATLATLKISNLEAGPKTYLKLLIYRYLRLAPVYYMVFLFGWQIGPVLGAGPCWFTYEKGFSECKEYWWSVFTMTSNFIPKNTTANAGCFFWGWFPPCEIQIILLLPWLVWLTVRLESNKKL